VPLGEGGKVVKEGVRIPINASKEEKNRGDWKHMNNRRGKEVLGH